MELVAEGVENWEENREEWDLVESLGIDYVQGFFCARPMPNNELMTFTADWSPPPSRISD